MKIREIYRQELALRGIRLKDMLEAEKWADQRCVFGAVLMDSECPVGLEPMMHKILGGIADEAYAPLRDRQ